MKQRKENKKRKRKLKGKGRWVKKRGKRRGKKKRKEKRKEIQGKEHFLKEIVHNNELLCKIKINWTRTLKLILHVNTRKRLNVSY